MVQFLSLWLGIGIDFDHEPIPWSLLDLGNLRVCQDSLPDKARALQSRANLPCECSSTSIILKYFLGTSVTLHAETSEQA